jgi:hypothetical protein
MPLQPSASRTSLLLACPRPFDPELEVESSEAGEAARYGSAFHQVLAACLETPAKKPLERSARYAHEVGKGAAKYDVKSTAHELAGHVKSSAQVLRNWLGREKLGVSEIERSYAVAPSADGGWNAREIPPHDEEHRYEVEPGELPGTVDLIARDTNRTRTVVLDHKTGSLDPGFAQPAKLAQMKTLGLIGGAKRCEGNRSTRSVVEVAIFHADRRGLPIVYAEPYEGREQRRHAVELHAAFARIGSGFMRAGPQCTYCPARFGCPARTADLLAESTAALVEGANKLAVEPLGRAIIPSGAGLAIEERAGVLYELLKCFRALDEAGTKEIRRLVQEGKIIETRDGKVLAIRTEKFETLSKKSVIEALGKVAGEKELKRLRAKGAIREATREKLVTEK